MQCCNLPWEQEVDGSNPFAPIYPNRLQRVHLAT